MTNIAIRLITAGLLALAMAAPAQAAQRTITSESIKEDLIAARCKEDAKKYYSIFQLKKRRLFERNCIERAYR
jgi:hypothetical protein